MCGFAIVSKGEEDTLNAGPLVCALKLVDVVLLSLIEFRLGTALISTQKLAGAAISLPIL